MGERLDELVSRAGEALGGPSELRPGMPDGARGGELAGLLQVRNGFYAFDDALHVFGTAPRDAAEFDVVEWNSPGLWRNVYGTMARGMFFFAEDVFGVQFGIARSRVFVFDPETGESELIAHDLDAWAGRVLANPALVVGWAVAREWRRRAAPLDRGTRLAPRVPFAEGGGYEIENLEALDAVEGMRRRGRAAAQLAA